jgi:hypothetical protein
MINQETLLVTIIIILILIIIIIICYISNKIKIQPTIRRSPKKINLYDEDLILQKYLKSIKHKSVDIIISTEDVGYPLF